MRIKLKYINNKRAFCYCPYHEDKNASFEICMTGEYYGKYYCFSCGRSGTLTKGMMEMLESQKTKRKSNDRRTSNVDWDKLNEQYRENVYEWDGPSLLGLEWKVSPDVLDDLNMGYDIEAYTFPMRNEYNEIIGIQRRFPDGFKCAVEDSCNGLFVPLPIPDIYDQVFICEGVSDLATLLELGFYGVARPNYNSCNDMVDTWLRVHLSDEMLYDHVFIIADNDQPGSEGAAKLSEQIGIPGSNIIIPNEKDLRKEVEVLGREETERFIKLYTG